VTQILRLAKSPRSSGVVVSGGRIETSGIVTAPGVARDIASQTRSVLQQLEELLRLAGASKRQLVTMQIWLADMKDFDDMNSVYDLWVAGTDQPARVCVGAKLATDEYLIEVQATAVV
jgi:enamine deaminase RidA (YjgF/YER057c/UK114 family)